jgi:MarR family protein
MPGLGNDDALRHERLSLTSGAVTMLVDRLERAGWVQRRIRATGATS